MRVHPPFAAFATCAFLLVACDPVQTNEIDALGGEAPGVPHGPLHRPGQPCTLCHDGALGNPTPFSVAGTIYVNETDKTAAVDAVVALTDSEGHSYKATTNAAGNFYATPNQFTPVYPMKVAVTYDGITVEIASRIGRAASCATCHTDPAGPTSAGHVFVPTDGVTP